MQRTKRRHHTSLFSVIAFGRNIEMGIPLLSLYDVESIMQEGHSGQMEVSACARLDHKALVAMVGTLRCPISS
jgi:hypothetical protein